MFQLTILYGRPDDTAAFDRYYREIHVPLARKMPGLRGYIANKPGSLDPQGQSPTYFIAELYFDDLAALQTALQSPEGQAAAADVANFATGGSTTLFGEIQIYNPASIA